MLDCQMGLQVMESLFHEVLCIHFIIKRDIIHLVMITFHSLLAEQLLCLRISMQ